MTPDTDPYAPPSSPGLAALHARYDDPERQAEYRRAVEDAGREAAVIHAIDRLVARWYDGEGIGVRLHDWIGMSKGEYDRWAMDCLVLPKGYVVPEWPIVDRGTESNGDRS